MRGDLLAGVLALAVGACQISTPIDEEATSGARLRRALLRPESGEPMFAGWYDRELDVSCAFEMAADGRLRCVPSSSSLEVYYLDPACAEHVTISSAVCPEDRFGRMAGEPTGCWYDPVPVELFAIDAEERSVDHLYAMGPHGCAPEYHPAVVRRVTPLEPTRFVAAEWVHGQGEGPLVRDRLVAEDGATQAWTLRDVARDVSCSLPRRSRERLPCVPSGTVNAIRACDEIWIGETADGCSSPVGVRWSDGDVALYTRTEQVSEAERLEVEWCAGVGLPPLLYRTRRDDEALPWLTREWRGEGRLQRMTWGDAGGAPLWWWPRYYDRELDHTCEPMATPIGTRCVPGYVTFTDLPLARRTGWNHFADAACTRPALEASSTAEAASGFVVQAEPLETCSPTEQLRALYRIGERMEVVYRRDATAGCVVDDRRVGFALEPIAFEALARVDRVTE